MNIFAVTFKHKDAFNNENNGWGNGYVLIPEGNKLFGMFFDDINKQYSINVHGGLTFSKLLTERHRELLGENAIDGNLIPNDIAFWMIGFDTCHIFDNKSNWSRDDVENETRELLKQVLEIQ